MPCFNAAKFVADSVKGILSQTISDFELIVVDDASKDDSAPILRGLAAQDPRIKLVFHERNGGASRSRNDGLRLARGDYIGFCDADDIWKPEKLEIQIQALALQNAALTYCDSEIIDENGRLTGARFSDRFPPPPKHSGNLFTELCTNNFINMQTVLLKRTALGDNIFFDESIKWVEDWWQWLRLSRHFEFVYDERPLALYRVHPKSTNVTQRHGIRRNRWKVCRRNLEKNPDMPIFLQASMWYQMAVELSEIRRHRTARRFLWKSGTLTLRDRESIKTLFTTWARFLIEFFRGLRLA